MKEVKKTHGYKGRWRETKNVYGLLLKNIDRYLPTYRRETDCSDIISLNWECYIHSHIFLINHGSLHNIRSSKHINYTRVAFSNRVVGIWSKIKQKPFNTNFAHSTGIFILRISIFGDRKFTSPSLIMFAEWQCIVIIRSS